jgi:hypothetical protein
MNMFCDSPQPSYTYNHIQPRVTRTATLDFSFNSISTSTQTKPRFHIFRIDDDCHARHLPVASDRSLRKLQTSTCRGKTTLIIHDILVPQSMITACGSSEDTYFSTSYRASCGSQLLPRRETEKVVLFKTRHSAWREGCCTTRTESFS